MNPNKTPYKLLHWPFIAAMAENMRDGLTDDRQPGDWKGTPEKYHDEYWSALIRHAVEFEQTGDLKALAAVACNSMILYGLKKDQGVKYEKI